MSSLDAPSLFRAVVASQPERLALVCAERRLSWSELGLRVNRVANALGARGIGRGDRVAILGKSSVEYVAAFFGVLSAGACAVPLPGLASAEALGLMLADSSPRLVFVSREARASLPPGATPVVELEDPSFLADVPAACPNVELRPEDEFNIIYSSGTTGVPKGIVHSHATRQAFISDLRNFGFGPGAVSLLSTPLYSNTTMVAWLPSMCFGATQILMPKFDAGEWLSLVERERVTHTMLVPVQYERILRERRLESSDLSSLRLGLCTSAPLKPETKRAIVARLPGALVEIYGLTEGGVTSVLLASAYPDKLESVGQPAPGCTIKIVGDDERELPVGAVGEIVGRSGFMMRGYNNLDHLSDAMVWRDERGDVYYRSGDLGRLDEDGFVYVLDRKKDMIISGGQNVYAVDIENVLSRHPAVAEAAVVGVPSVEWGETPLALVVLEPGTSLDAETLREWVNARVSKHQRVSGVELRDELPRTSLGKLSKRELRAPYWEGA